MGGIKNLFKTPKLPNLPEPKLPTPKVVRMPTESDASLQEAQRRTYGNYRRRKGRQSTILTDREFAGSNGRLLGS